jgi:hypothetical protein
VIIIIVAIVLPFKIKRQEDAAPAPTTTAKPTSTPDTHIELNECLLPFMAPGYALGVLYPCGSCMDKLASSPNDFLADGAATGIGAMRQYCALMSVLFASSLSHLHAGKWGADMDPCGGWEGVACDERGRITALEMVYPGVPSELPASFSNLVALHTLRVVGDGKRPAGLLPPNITSLPHLSTLDIQYTNLGGAVGVTPALRSLTLVANPALRPPANMSAVPLDSLTLADQNLTALPALPPSLRSLDLSHNALTGSLSPLMGLPHLRSLYLQHNDLERFIPPPGAPIEALSVAGNPRLVGGLWSATCEGLRACDAHGTAMNRNCTRCYYDE